MADLKQHWEHVYETKTPEQVSWTQDVPKTSLALIASCSLSKSANIIDIGGGDSRLVDHLLDAGFQNITVLDISAAALERAKKRLGVHADKVNWIVTDITDFAPSQQYDLWHDRAAFHFLTASSQVEKYKDIVNRAVSGYAVIGTFSRNGPLKCSGLQITQYDDESLGHLFSPNFGIEKCFTEDHNTPFGTTQNFLFCCFKRKNIHDDHDNHCQD